MATDLTYPTRPAEPGWVDSGAAPTGGLDLLGLRLSVQAIGARLLNGVTTITPTIRYLSLRTWLVDRHIHAPSPRPDTLRDFVRFARAGEAAFVLANILREPTTLYLIGTEWAQEQIRLDLPEIPLGTLWKQRAVNTSAGPCDQLRLTEDRKNGAPELSLERGRPLAVAVHQTFGATSLGRRLSADLPLETLARDEVEEFATVASVHDIPEAERAQMLDALLPVSPLPDERARLATYGVLLSLARLHGRLPEERDLFQEVVRSDVRLDPPLAVALDGWLTYLVRDMVAVTAEVALQGVLEALREVAGGGGGRRGRGRCGADRTHGHGRAWRRPARTRLHRGR